MSAHHWQSAQCVALATQACCPTSCWYLNTVLCTGHKVWRELCFGVGQAICRNNPSPHSIATTHQHNLQPEEFQHSYLEECCGDTCSLSSLYLAKPPCTWPERTTAWSWRKRPLAPKRNGVLGTQNFSKTDQQYSWISSIVPPIALASKEQWEKRFCQFQQLALHHHEAPWAPHGFSTQPCIAVQSSGNLAPSGTIATFQKPGCWYRAANNSWGNKIPLRWLPS